MNEINRFDGLTVLQMFLPSLPVCLVWLAAIILAFVYWSRHPRVCLLTFLGALILLIQSVLGTFLFYWLTMVRAEVAGLPMQTSLMYFGIFRAVASTAGGILIVLAIFTGRRYALPAATFERSRPAPTPAHDLPEVSLPPGAFRS